MNVSFVSQKKPSQEEMAARAAAIKDGDEVIIYKRDYDTFQPLDFTNSVDDREEVENSGYFLFAAPRGAEKPENEYTFFPMLHGKAITLLGLDPARVISSNNTRDSGECNWGFLDTPIDYWDNIDPRFWYDEYQELEKW